MEKKKRILEGKINLTIGLIGGFIIILGLFTLFNINTEFLMYLLIVIGLLLLTWQAKLKKSIKESK